MKTFYFTQNSSCHLRSIRTHAVMLTVLALLVSFGLSTQAFAYTQINQQLDFGERNIDVTHLQEFLAGDASIYPEGLVTGYFGGLTRVAVMRFQARYGFAQVGRVGPLTLSKINSLIASGGWTTSDMSGPAFSSVSLNKNNTSATLTFNTNENTRASVVYHTSPLMFNEGDINSNGFGAIGGFTATSNANPTTFHSVTVPNLQPNTLYYYTVIATDLAGNASVVGPNNRFRTAP